MALITLPTELLDKIGDYCAQWPRATGNLLALRLTCRRFNAVFRSHMHRAFIQQYNDRHFDISYGVARGGHYVHQVLCKLIRAGNETVLRDLLDIGADVNPGVQHGMKQKHRRRRFRTHRHVPLIVAIVDGKDSLALMLVKEYGAEVNVVDRKGRDALFLAVSHGMTNLVDLLLREANEPSQAWMFCQGSAGHPAWLRAIANGHVDVLRLLIKASHRAPYDAPERLERCNEALQLASELGNEAAVKLILSETACDPDLGKKSRTRPINLAARNGHWSVVKILLETGQVSPNSRGDLDRTVLSFAAQHGTCDIAEYLLGLDGVDPDSQDQNGRTPLMHAVGQGRIDMVNVLLGSGLVDVNRVDKRGNTALIISVKKDLTCITRRLLEMEDINVRTRNLDGRTATQIARDHVLTEIEKLLIDKGARLNAENNK